MPREHYSIKHSFYVHSCICSYAGRESVILSFPSLRPPLLCLLELSLGNLRNTPSNYQIQDYNQGLI